ncbi:TLD domain-containing 2, putative [Babesia ovata]|uniref:Oxidation resistance protein 1 n=1 Tax=Babesia ovata TaxID=189622 RepID=A0A2H6KCQ4_9APIC|nr:TLD domain-containing 2, putative [Babesia ovata]GBE60739.1 TLD domain-containing 2, putative [Babesia ovata]
MRPGTFRQLVEVSRSATKQADAAEASNQPKPYADSIIFSEVCHYCITGTPILGTLTLTTEAITFEPDARDANVYERGRGYYQVHVDLVSIEECGLIGVSAEDLSSYDRGSMHCNGLLQILLKNGRRDSPAQTATEDPFDPFFCEHRIVSKAQTPPPRESRSVSLVSQGISKLSYVANMAGFSMAPKTPPEKPPQVAVQAKVFVVFAFFKKEVAHRCTLALMDALDEAKKRAAAMPSRSRISRVPFTSNELLHMLTESIRPEEQAQQRRRRSSESRSRKSTTKNTQPSPNVDGIVESENKLREKVAQKSRILTADMVSQLVDNLPPALAIRDWDITFKTSHDGVSFGTFYKNLDGHEHCLIVIKDDNGNVFGTFTGHIELSYRFYGTAETFVFKFDKGRIRVYRAKGNNKCFVYSNESTIVIGGGANSALSIHDAFQSGTTAACETFGNDPLAPSFVFNIEEMEVWTFGGYLV